MTVNVFKQQILNAASAADFKTFHDLQAKISEFCTKWNDIYLSKSGDTVAHLAAKSGCVEILKYCHETGNGTLLEQRNFDGKTPLHIAVQACQLECVVCLLAFNVAVDSLKRADWTPLMLACTKDSSKIIEILLSHGANPWCVNKDGWTAFHIAAREGNTNVVNCLLKNDPRLWKTRSKNRRTPLHTAALHGHLETVKSIITYEDCNKDIQDSCGTTPLMDAASGNHKHLVEYLIQIKKVDFEKTDVMGRNVLHLAAQSGSLECLQYLIKVCLMDINQKTKDGLSALHFAAKENKAGCINLLLKLGADPLQEDNRGRLDRIALESDQEDDVLWRSAEKELDCSRDVSPYCTDLHQPHLGGIDVSKDEKLTSVTREDSPLLEVHPTDLPPKAAKDIQPEAIQPVGESRKKRQIAPSGQYAASTDGSSGKRPARKSSRGRSVQSVLKKIFPEGFFKTSTPAPGKAKPRPPDFVRNSPEKRREKVRKPAAAKISQLYFRAGDENNQQINSTNSATGSTEESQDQQNEYNSTTRPTETTVSTTVATTVSETETSSEQSETGPPTTELPGQHETGPRAENAENMTTSLGPKVNYHYHFHYIGGVVPPTLPVQDVTRQ